MIDLDDLTGTTAGGLHLATMGGLWQAFAFGFAGLRARDGVLDIDPRMPPKWQRLELRVRFRGSRVRVGIDASVLVVTADEPIEVAVAGRRASVGPRGRTFRRSGAGWEVER
jgi:trehalose/maltose hydrolase-like predicted phosphorylase